MSKVEELKEKLNEVIETLKKKVPKLGKKSDDDDEEFEDEFEEDTGQVEVNPSDMGEEIDAEDATATDIGEAAESDEEEDEDDEEDDDDEDEKKKKKKKLLIQGLLGAVILYLAFDILMTEDETLVVQEPVKKARKRPKKRRVRKKQPKQVENEQAKANNKKEQPKDAVAKKEPAPVATPVEEPKEVVETKKEQPKKEVEQETIVSPPKEEPVAVATPSPTPVAESTPVTTPTPEPTPEPTEEAGGIPPETPAEPLDMQDSEEEAPKSLTMDDKVDEILEKSKEGEQKPETKKEETKNVPEEYVEPPTYKRLGRGLVYNCIGKHWACVDKFSYFQCRENYKWSKAQGKKPECAIKNVYASEKDCGVVQLHYINTREATEFCEGVSDEENANPETKVMVQ